jgi:hypothetical protein
LKYLITLLVCALLTVSLIFSAEILIAILPEPKAGMHMGTHWITGAWLIAVMLLPLLLFAITFWSVIGFTKTVKRWIAENQVDDGPAIMHSRHSKDAHDLLEQHRKDTPPRQ